MADPAWETRVDNMLADKGVNRAFGLMMFEIAKASKTGNWAFFDTVTDLATFKTLFKSMIQ